MGIESGGSDKSDGDVISDGKPEQGDGTEVEFRQRWAGNRAREHSRRTAECSGLSREAAVSWVEDNFTGAGGSSAFCKSSPILLSLPPR